MSFAIWGNASASRMSAAMTYFTMLSLAPLLVIAIAIAGLFYGDGKAKAELVEQVTLLTDENIASTVSELISNTTRPESGLLASVVSLAVLVFGASGVFSQLRETFNEIWGVPNEERQGIWLTIKTRLIGILMVFVAGFLLLTTLFLSTAVAAVSNLFSDWPQLKTWLELADRSVSFLLIPIILSLLFWLIPRTEIHLNDVWPAAMVTALFLSLSRFLIEFYLQYSSTSEVYGAAGSLVVLLIWIYMSGLVLFYGASFSRAWSE
ncbi:MAG: YihY/virulence factor BrkB family protein, partial [Planctomycetota bacterium]